MTVNTILSKMAKSYNTSSNMLFSNIGQKSKTTRIEFVLEIKKKGILKMKNAFKKPI